MADLLSLRGLVAGGARPAEQNLVGQAQAAQRSEAITGGADARPASAPADTVEVRAAGVPLGLPGEQAELRQRAITSHEARAQALVQVTDDLAGVREGRPGALAEFRAGVDSLGNLIEAGPNLAKLLLQVNPSAAQAIDPGLVETAQVETENALAATYGEVAVERRALSVALVSAENEAASRVEFEQLERAAERLRGQEEAAGPAGLLEAFRGPMVSRTRIVELLLA